MADGTIQVPVDGLGKYVDTSVISTVHRERINISDPTSLTGLATVTSSAGLQTTLTSGTVTLSSQHTITNVSASSGFVQISGTPTVTSTLGTNPWSSAPGFNVPVLSASSGLIQVSGTVTVLSASSGLVQISGTPSVTVQGSSGGTVLVTASGAMSVTISTAAGAGSTTVNVVGSSNATAPATSSGGLLVTAIQSANYTVVSASSGLVQVSGIATVLSASSGAAVPVIAASSAGGTPTFVSATTVSKLSSSPSKLCYLSAFSTLATLVFARVYDATTSSVVVGTSVKMVFPCGLYSTAATAPPFGFNGSEFGPLGVTFTSGISFDGAATTTSTAAVVASVKLTAVYV